MLITLDLPLSYHADIEGQSIPYRVTVSTRARTGRLVIRPESGLTVVIPHRGRIDPRALVERHARWIRKHLDRLDNPCGEALSPLVSGSKLAYLGMTLRLELAPPTDQAPVVERIHDVLRVRTGQLQSLSTILETWYHERASDVIAERLAAVNGRLGYAFRRVSIRDQKTRWGSCSARGDLAFNWRLVMAPLEIIDYVMAHELVHLKDLSHSDAFWARVARIDPDYGLHRRWLNNYGASLRLGAPRPQPRNPRPTTR